MHGVMKQEGGVDEVAKFVIASKASRLTTGIPQSCRLSFNKNQLYYFTITNCCVCPITLKKLKLNFNGGWT